MGLQRWIAEDELVGWHHQLNELELEQTPGDREGQGGLVCCSPWGCKDSDTTEWLNNDKQTWTSWWWKPEGEEVGQNLEVEVLGGMVNGCGVKDRDDSKLWLFRKNKIKNKTNFPKQQTRTSPTVGRKILVNFSYHSSFACKNTFKTWVVPLPITFHPPLEAKKPTLCCFNLCRTFLPSLRHLLTFYFALGYRQLTNNVVIVSGEQWKDSAIHIHVSILPQTPLPSRLPHNMEQSFLC